MEARDGTTHIGRSGSSVIMVVTGIRPVNLPLPNPAEWAASAPATNPSAKHSLRVKRPLQEPTERSGCTDGPGAKQACLWSQCTLPPDCECRCTGGVHPPETAP